MKAGKAVGLGGAGLYRSQAEDFAYNPNTRDYELATTVLTPNITFA